MITAEMIVGKITLFICQKATGAILKLPFDKRRRACRSLTKLYYCLQGLDDVTESIFQHVQMQMQHSKHTGPAFVVMSALSAHLYEIELATNMFLDLGNELYSGLEILDPALAQCCDALYISKGDFLTQMSKAIAWEGPGHSGRVIIKMPRETVDLPELENTYSKAAAALQYGELLYWPDTLGLTEDRGEIILSWEDSVSAERFIKKIAQHREVLIDAKNKLRELLKSSFSIEEVLFQTDTHPYR